MEQDLNHQTSGYWMAAVLPELMLEDEIKKRNTCMKKELRYYFLCTIKELIFINGDMEKASCFLPNTKMSVMANDVSLTQSYNIKLQGKLATFHCL